MDFPKQMLFPGKVIFNKGAYLSIAKECLELGNNGIVVCGCSLDRSGKKEEILQTFVQSSRVECFIKEAGEPCLDQVSRLIDNAKSINADWVVGIGGGSVLDLAKASAGLFNAKENPQFYQEGGVLLEKGIPFIAVPTSAGSGSEATNNAVIINKEKKAKLSIRDDRFLARKVILDVELLRGVPSSVLSYSGIDAFVQAYESFISKNSTWFSRNLAKKAIELIDKNILPAYDSRDEDSLSSLLLGSFLAGVALSSSRLGVIHGIAHPLGVLYNLPHGLVCSACFAPSVRLNKEIIGDKYRILSDIVNEDFLKRISFLLKSLNIASPFKDKPIIEKEQIILETLKSGSTAASPKKISRRDVEYILKEVF